LNMRSIKRIATVIWFSMIVIPSAGIPETAQISGEVSYDLAGERSRETQYFIHTSEMVSYAPDGSRTGKDVYRLYLKVAPVSVAGKETFQYTCVRFVIQPNGAKETTLPSLANWWYIPVSGIDGKNQVFGIDHDRFRNLTDSTGNVLSFDKAYHVYNTFIDFLAFTSVYADRTPGNGGIQDVHRIGEKIVHCTAFLSAPTNLGDNISEGSFFKSGEATLEFKGLSVVNGRPCALVGVDSGEGSLKMIMRPTPDLNMTVVGLSHYKGEIYRDLASNWVQKVTFNEIVVSETTIPALSQKIHSVIERNILISNVGKDEFVSRRGEKR
jgi:hypothetical protein